MTAKPAVDLRGLALRREEPPSTLRPPTRLVSRVLLPAAILAGFAGILAWAARDSLLPAREVTVAPVLVARATVQQAGTTAFQAAGWVEPRPTPVIVPALAEGIIERMLVVEGQEVQAGDAVAHLIDIDARLALAETQAQLNLLQAERERAQATLAAAQQAFEHPVTLEAALAEAEAMLVKTRSELANLPFQTKAAVARAELARQDLEGKARAGEGIAGRALQRAQSELDAATAALEELKQRPLQLEREAQALERKRDAAAQQLELKIDETRALAQAKAELQAAEARVTQAQVALDKAKLRLERMIVRSPQSGRVLELVGRPGRRVMGQDVNALHDSSTVVTLYDPQQLQVRADVRLADVPRVQPGQRCRIETPAVEGHLEGEVLFATSVANEAKNTLEVKVAIVSPPPVIKPQMLVQVTGLAMPSAEAPSQRETLRVLAPRSLVETGEQGSFVWLVDAATGAAAQRRVKLGGTTSEGLVEIVEGLSPGDRLISSGREGLQPGDRVRIAGEDDSLGMPERASSAPKHH